MNRPPKNMISVTRNTHMPSVDASRCCSMLSKWCCSAGGDGAWSSPVRRPSPPSSRGELCSGPGQCSIDNADLLAGRVLVRAVVTIGVVPKFSVGGGDGVSHSSPRAPHGLPGQRAPYRSDQIR